MRFTYIIKGSIQVDTLDNARVKIVEMADKIQATSVDIISDLDDECIILKRRTVV